MAEAMPFGDEILNADHAKWNHDRPRPNLGPLLIPVPHADRKRQPRRLVHPQLPDPHPVQQVPQLLGVHHAPRTNSYRVA